MLDHLATRVNADANLVRRGKHVNTSFLIAIDNADHIVRVEYGRIASMSKKRAPAFRCSACTRPAPTGGNIAACSTIRASPKTTA